jgi:DNA-binding Lrp family transcriptional regulator
MRNMAQAPAEALDVKDRKILYELDRNARQSFSEMGKRVGMSKEVVAYRVGRLLEKGVVKGFYAVLDLSKLGYASYRAYFRLPGASPAEEAAMLAELAGRKDVWWLCSFNGEWDVALGSWARSSYEFERTWHDILSKYRGKIADEKISIHQQIHQFSRAYLLGKEKAGATEIVTGGEERAECDELDFRILRAIAGNARASTVELAKKTGTAPTVVAYRLKKLEEKKVLRGYRAMLDLAKLGVLWYKLAFKLNSFERHQEMMKWARAHPAVTWAFDSLGGWDVELEVEAHSVAEVRAVLNEFRAAFSKDIRSLDYFEIYKEHKIVYMPAKAGQII